MGSGPFNAHRRGGGGGGLVQYVFRSPERNPARQSSRRGSCAAQLSEKRSSLCYTIFRSARALQLSSEGLAEDCGPKCPQLQQCPASQLLASIDFNSDFTKLLLNATRRHRHHYAKKVQGVEPPAADVCPCAYTRQRRPDTRILEMRI